MSTLPALARRMTAEEYLAWEETQDVRHHFWGGEAFPVHPEDDSLGPDAMAGGTTRHAEIGINAGTALKQALRGRGCRTFSGDLRIQLDDRGTYVYPDLSVVCGPVETAGDRDLTLLNPTLVLEVLSPSTEAFDRGGKATAYRRLPSLDVLVLVSQDRPAAEVYRREGARWTVEDAAGLDATVSLLGADVALADLYDGVEFPERVRPPGFG